LSNLVTRTLSSIVFVVLILGPLYLDDRRIAFTLYSILGLFTLREIHGLLAKTKTHVLQVASILVYLILVYQFYNLWFQSTFHSFPILLVLLVSLIVKIRELFNQNDQPFQVVSSTIWSSIFVAVPFLGIAYFMEYRNDLPTEWMTISLFALIWINDSGAYLVGRKIGRTKLFERLSPNKTWEGSIGGLISSLLAGFGLSYVTNMPSSLIMIGFAATCIVFGSLGDLFQSRLKRAANVKDSGKFLPGHGGFFDRFDAMILAVPAAIVYFELVAPKP
jgi:phosphatidate cytidylyltransferase